MTPDLHPKIVRLLDVIMELSAARPNEFSDADLSAALGSLIAIQSAMFLSANSRDSLVHVMVVGVAGGAPTREEIEAGMNALLGRESKDSLDS